LRAVVESAEVYNKEYTSAFVAMQYFGYLRRDPEAEGYEAWLRVINSNPADYRTMVWGFVTSIEYRNRFGQAPQPGTIQLPAEANAWLVTLATSGGFTGRGDGGVSITSRGDAVANRPRLGPSSGAPCNAKLSAEDLRRIDQLVAAAERTAWRDRYVDPNNPHGCCDQFVHQLTLQRRKADGTADARNTFWYDGSTTLLPKDLFDLWRGAVVIKDDVLRSCGN
jgi:hypothetical protein